MNTMYTKLSTGKDFQTASEDPVSAAKSMKYTSYLTEIEQYKSNAEDAESRLSVTESSIDVVEDILERVRELTVQGANGVLSDTDLEAIQSETEALTEQLLETSNTTYVGNALFGGYNVTTSPFVLNSDGVMLYNGAAMNLSGPYSADMSDTDIQAIYNANASTLLSSDASNQNMIFNIGDNSKVDVNVEGQELFGIGSNSLFSIMDKINMAFDGETSYKSIDDSTSPITITEETLNLSDLLDELDTSLDNVRTVKAEVGARASYVEMVSTRLSQDYNTYTELLSANEDADITEVAMYLSNAETVYNASLSAGSKIILPTLIDFIG
ncbi:MAG: flagellar hook-associated protein FlgL, partial [Clostridia bacterium]|nr:flagellar hook-associated protein FlgL [Clostridia bacterium]